MKNTIDVICSFQYNIHEKKVCLITGDINIDHLGTLVSVDFLHCKATIFLLFN